MLDDTFCGYYVNILLTFRNCQHFVYIYEMDVDHACFTFERMHLDANCS